MASYKVLHLLILLIACLSASAQYYFQPFQPAVRHANNQFYRPPWISEYRDFYEHSPSEPYASYSTFPKHYRDSIVTESRFDAPVDRFLSSSTKKIPREDKSYKKAVSPFYTITEKDSDRYKSLVFKSGVPYCEEVRTKRSADGKNKEDGSMLCYKCKNPKGGETYEQCSFVSEPAKKDEKPISLRSRRSNSEETSKKSSFDHPYFKKSENNYRFSEDIFADLSQEVPVEYKNKDEKCERVVKDTMVCMVCEDKKTNGKYEQCSYVRQPTKKAYSYVKSSTFNDPGTQKKEGNDESESSEKQPEPTKQERKFSYPQQRHRNDRNEEKRAEASESEETSDCKQIQKESQSCMVCKDKKTGGSYEKCSYAYQPNDKVYKFSRSKSFGQPRDSSSKEETNPNKEETYGSGEHSEPFSKYTRDYYFPSGFYGSDGEQEKSGGPYGGEKSSSYRRPPIYDFDSIIKGDKETSPSSPYKSESEAASEKIDGSSCKKVNKNGMVCDVCKDPKTGNDFERCSYSYEPNDRSYSYSKSRAFGSPAKESKESGEDSKESREYPYQFEYPSKAYGPSGTDKEEYREFPIASETKSAPKEEPVAKNSETTPKPADMGFYDTLKKKAEIEKFVQQFQKEDRSNCKKVVRDKMTCYQCIDMKGFQKEECAFVTTQEPSKDKLAYREVKEVQVEPAKKVPRSIRFVRRSDDYMEPVVSASQNYPVKQEAPAQEESQRNAQMHDFADETRPVYDKVLGLSLPAYMLEVSEHEAEFDEVVKSSRF